MIVITTDAKPTSFEEVFNKGSKDVFSNKIMEHSVKAWNIECAQEGIQIKHEGRHQIHLSESSTKTVNRKLLCDTQSPHTVTCIHGRNSKQRRDM